MIHYLYLGRVDYAEALRLQEELVALRQQNRIGNVLLLLEHPPVLTLGRNANRSNILASDEMLAARGVTLHEINRGGDVTYHGPGQLIGYPIFDLRSLRNANGGRLGPVDFVRLMEEALIRLSGEFGVQAGRICGLTGVWCGVPSPQRSSKGEPCAAPSKKPPARRARAQNRRHRHSRGARRHLARLRLQRHHGPARLRSHQSLRHHGPPRHEPRKRSCHGSCRPEVPPQPRIHRALRSPAVRLGLQRASVGP